MRILFMGTSSFAVPSLEALISSKHEVIGVVTQPDRPSGRGRHMRPSPVKNAAEGVELFQPESVREDWFISSVGDISPDLIVVAAFGQIIPKSILDIPRFGCVNVHGSLLPRHRGAAPVQYALFCGDPVTGVSTMLMDPGLDTGPVLMMREVEILPEDDAGSLEAKLAEEGAGLLLETISGLEDDSVVPVPQDSSLATYAPSIKREECEIEWRNSAVTIINRMRGCSPRPGAYTYLGDSILKVWSAAEGDISDADALPGEVMESGDEGIAVCAGTGCVIISELQPENGKRMSAMEFARGRLSREDARIMLGR